jgi:DNA-binding NarL/FixJ family response regulator
MQAKSKSLAQLVRNQSDAELLGTVVDPVELMVTVAETEPDVVVLESQTGQIPGVCTHLISEYPGLLIVILQPRSDRALLFRRALSREEISAANEDVLAAIRRALES